MSNFAQALDLIIQSEVDGKPRHEIVLELGKTPYYFIQHAGFPDLDLIINGSIISKAHFDHGIPTSTLKRLPEIIANPKSLYRSAHNDTSSVVVVSFEFQRRVYPVVIPVHPKKQVGRQRTCNVIASVYGKEGPDPEVKWQRQGLHIWTP